MNNYKVRLLVITIIAGVCLVLALLTWNAKGNAAREYKISVGKWNNELKVLKVVPTPENIFILKKEYEWLLDKEKELKQLFLKRQIPSTQLTPLQFKEELLSSQTKLKQLAEIQGCKLQEDLGFSKYATGQIPKEEDVVFLAKQLAIINELINLLLKHKVSEIDSIENLPDVYFSEGNFYQEIVFKLRIRCVLEDLLEFLRDTVNSPYILVVRGFKIDKSSENMVDVELMIGAVE